ncbi:MAG: arginine--tRNA ligase, partial [Clostridiales bacterium]|nr:arginine--tRNA ligase [Clostridiales bacterium]
MDYISEIVKLIKIEGIAENEIRASVTVASESAFGDYSLPCFKFSRALKKSPKDIADGIKNAIVEIPEFIEKIETIGGYLNFTLRRMPFVRDVLDEIFKKGIEYGASDEGKGKT